MSQIQDLDYSINGVQISFVVTNIIVQLYESRSLPWLNPCPNTCFDVWHMWRLHILAIHDTQ